ncbi:hypothetical protein HKD37_14G039660 [Glycine soja]
MREDKNFVQPAMACFGDHYDHWSLLYGKSLEVKGVLEFGGDELLSEFRTNKRTGVNRGTTDWRMLCLKISR